MVCAATQQMSTGVRMTHVSAKLRTRVTYAVRPTAEEPRPDVYMPRGASLCTAIMSCDLLVPGSPTSSTLSSPRTRPPGNSCTGGHVEGPAAKPVT